MIGNELENPLKSGIASRYIKPRWIRDGIVTTEAFNLRAGPPPESYVSHFLVSGRDLSESFSAAHKIISLKIQCDGGSIALLDIAQALEQVNDEVEPFIMFIEKELPHCGLLYVTANQEKILEAKATLCYLISNKISAVKDIVEKGISSQQSLSNHAQCGYITNPKSN